MTRSISNEIYDELVRISGPHANYKAITKRDTGADIYGSYHFPTFTRTNAQRQTLVRFDEFYVPDDLSGKTVFDFGSNLGSLTLEAVRRNCQSAKGFEFCVERVNVCNKLANYLGVDKIVEFVSTDINKETADTLSFIEKYGTSDITFCCALDAYVNREKLYEFVSAVTKDVCYFETNCGIAPDTFTNIMTQNGFKLILCIGTSRSDSGYGRISYLLVKNPQKFTSNELKNIHYKILDKVFCHYNNKATHDRIKNYYQKIKHIEYVPEMKFLGQYVITPYYTNRLDSFTPTLEEYKLIKEQVIDFVIKLNRAKLAHCDFHTSNCYFPNKQLKVCDWEYISDDDFPLEKCYDLTAPNSLDTDRICVFSTCSSSISRYLNGDIKLEEFIEAAKQ